MAIQALANDHTVLCSSPDPATIYTGSPGIWKTKSGRLIVTYDLRGEGITADNAPILSRRGLYGCIITSDDRGATWQERGYFPFFHARPFETDDGLYILGHDGDLMVIRSTDDGEVWSEPMKLTEGETWHQAPCNVCFANNSIYLVMEKRLYDKCEGWRVSEIAPVLMRASMEKDLTERANWTLASELVFADAVKDAELDDFGVPFYPAEYPKAYHPGTPGRACSPIGWLETNVVQITDPEHMWYDPEGMTFHLISRAHTGRTNLGCISQVVQKPDGSMETSLVRAPSGKKWVYMPIPGGQMKFHILYDEQTKLYWLLSTQSTDSMVPHEKLASTRYNLADNERRRLALHFSKNCVDWCFAGLVAQGEADVESRHYAAMAIDGDDLVIVSRSGDEDARNPHDVNLVTFHRVADFRNLVY